MKKANHQDRETLLNILFFFKIMIERSAAEYPTVVLGDIEKSLEYVLWRNDYTENDHKNHRRKRAEAEKKTPKGYPKK